MPRTVLTESDFLVLRSEMDEAVREWKKKPPDKSILPKEKGGRAIEAVSVGELFLTTLTAVARAKRKLKGSDIAIDMGSEPMEIKFTGTIAGISTGENDILMKLENE